MLALINRSSSRTLKVFVTFFVLWGAGMLVIGASVLFHEMGWRTAQLVATLLGVPIAIAWLCCCGWFLVEILRTWVFPWRRRA